MQQTADYPFDYVTFSGSGEPTLVKNLGHLIRMAGKITGKPVAVLTNASLLYRTAVRENLLPAAIVIAKLDAVNRRTFRKVNCPAPKTDINRIIAGLIKFRREFKNCFCLQLMFVRNNLDEASQLAELARKIRPDEVQLNTPLRYCRVKPVSPSQLSAIEKKFTGLKVRSVYRAKRHAVKPIDLRATILRHPFRKNSR